ncbi:MAG TPA: DUF6458 family protein [Actinomycetota bacterium]|nr:DUF6458 family protein [Actinomycetota bacterium]
MGIGVSIFLLAVGAILTWGVNFAVSGIDIDVIGIILMLIGLIGLLASLLFWSSFAPFGRERRVYREDTVVEDRPPLR